MGNWNDSLKKANKLKIQNGYIKYYKNPKSLINTTFAGRLKIGDIVEVKYDKMYDAMKITKCDTDDKAVGKYILSPKDNSDILVVDISTPKTTEATTTIDANGNVVPENTNGNGETSGSEVPSEPMYSDDAFFDIEYSVTYTNSKQYYDNLKNGLSIGDLRGILGLPNQFTPLTDPRIDIDPENPSIGENISFGRVYSEKIIKYMPLLLITPGVPSFMTSWSSDQKNSIMGRLSGIFSNDDPIDILSQGSSGKYYTLKYSYADYFNYVNAMLRSAAYFLEIQDETIDGKKLGTLNWLYQTSTMGSEIFSHGKMANFLGPYAGCIAFYADCGTSVDESFSNGTTESRLASTLNGLSDEGREMNFLVGNVGSEVGLQLTSLTGGTPEEMESLIGKTQSYIDGLLGGNSVISKLLGKAETLLAGGRIDFPEIWADSSFSRSYSCSMKLVSPSGDKLSIFLNILVPLYHILALTLPRQSVQQSYYSPFLIRAYSKGLFNVDMGIITSLSVSKGDEGEWSIDGIPTVLNINFEIKDLYDQLFMSKQDVTRSAAKGGYYDIMSNIQELDYIANSCGVNVNDQEVMRSIKMHMALGFSSKVDKVTIGIFGNTAQYFNQKMNNIFGKFK